MARKRWNAYKYVDGWLDDGAGCECKLNANVFVVDWNGERCCDVAAVGVCVCVCVVAMVVLVILPTLVRCTV